MGGHLVHIPGAFQETQTCISKSMLPENILVDFFRFRNFRFFFKKKQSRIFKRIGIL